MRITTDNPMAPRVLCFNHAGELMSHIGWVDLYTFEAKTIDGRDLEVAEIILAHPTGRKFKHTPIPCD